LCAEGGADSPDPPVLDAFGRKMAKGSSLLEFVAAALAGLTGFELLTDDL